MAAVDPKRFPICTDTVTLADGAVKECGQRHIMVIGNVPSCPDHVRKGKNNPRQGLPCSQAIAKGLKKCRYHQPVHTRSNKATAAKAAADKQVAKLEAEAEKLVRRWGVLVETTPMDSVLDMIKLWAGIERFWRAHVEGLQDADASSRRIIGRQVIEPRSPLVWGITKAKAGGDDHGVTYEAAPHIYLVLHERASDRLFKFAAEAVKAGIELRKVQLAEQEGALVADAIRLILTALELTPAQQAKVPEVVPRALRMIQGGVA